MIFVATMGRMTFVFEETDLEIRADSHLEVESPVLVDEVCWLPDVDGWLEVF